MIILEGIVAEKQEEKLKAIIPQTNLNIVQHSLLCTPELGAGVNEKGAGSVSGATLESYFLVALYWSLGAALVEELQVRFDTDVIKQAQLTEDSGPGPVAGPSHYPVQYSLNQVAQVGEVVR
eukprot:Em0023g818a